MRHRAFVAVAVLLLAGLQLVGAIDPKNAAFVPLRHAHAHNDYEHPRPLHDALDHGFCSIEADVFLTDKQLLVGHTRAALRPERTLQALYLTPLRERIRANHGRVYPNGPTVFLLIDVKSAAKPTYAALRRVLANYADILSVSRNGRLEPGAVTAVVSGNCDRQAILADKVAYAGIDGRLSDLDSEVPASQMPWISANWGLVFRWTGKGPIPPDEQARLDQFVRKAHQHGRLLRFWATPEDEVVWQELRRAGVDLLNTDQLARLQQFLLKAS
jgi:hypothetical protein